MMEFIFTNANEQLEIQFVTWLLLKPKYLGMDIFILDS